jgi:hypothetical protein
MPLLLKWEIGVLFAVSEAQEALFPPFLNDSLGICVIVKLLLLSEDGHKWPKHVKALYKYILNHTGQCCQIIL